MTATTRWVLGIVGLLAGNGIAVGVLIATSSAGGGRVIPDYYERAAHYDDAIDEARASRELGWHVELAVAGGRLEARVRDRAGAPVTGARAHLEGRARADGRALGIELSSDGAGRYVAPRPPHMGWTDLVLTVERSGRRYVEHAALELR